MNTFKYLLFHASPICPLSRKMPCPIVLAHCRKWNRILTARVLSRPGAHLGILGEQGRLRPPADPARQRACVPAKRLIRKMGGSRSAPLLTLRYALTFALWSRHPVPAARRFQRASFDRGRSRLLSRGYRWFESILPPAGSQERT